MVNNSRKHYQILKRFENLLDKLESDTEDKQNESSENKEKTVDKKSS